MSNKSFVHLHVHADGSALDGLAQVKKLVPAAEQLGMPAIALTDHGSMSATYDLYKATKDSGVKPIYGIEGYHAPNVPRDVREPVRWAEGGEDDVSGAGAYTHLTMLAETNEGLKNLFKISSESYLTGFYRKPRSDDELLAAHAAGIIATSGCPSGEVQTWLRIGNYKNAKAAAAKFADIFGKDNYFIELMDHGLGIEKRVIPQLLQLAKDLDLRTVATNDLHYVHRQDAIVHDALLCIGSGSKIADEKRFRFDAQDFYLKSAAEMRAIWDERAPDACDNTLLIAERCVATFEHGEDLMPQFPVPQGETEATWLDKEVQRGLKDRYPEGVPQDRIEQAKYEVGVINQMGFPGYFLVTADFINWAKKNGIRVGPGRGSAAGSIVAYSLGITDIDPMRHGLMFERFLNPERVSMPDIDVDFDDRNRHRVIEYVINKYGADKVANITTFMSVKAKAAIKDSARVLGMPYFAGDQLTKVYPQPIVGRDLALQDAYDPANERYEEAAEFRSLAKATPENEKIVELARGLEGVRRGHGMHAAGVIMSRKPLVETVPLMKRDANSPVMTQFEYPTCEYLGLLKMDFLGLSNLGTLDEALRLIKANRGLEIDLDQIGRELNDTKTFEMVARGETLGVFQLDSGPMRSLLKLMVPDSFEDISAVLALYRPGPMGAGTHIEYADRKNKRRPMTPIHRELAEPLKDILGETFGLIVYQEQVMAIAQKLAGYTLGQADLLRRAMGKKSAEILAKEFVPFHDGMIKNGYSEDAIRTLWEILVPFSDYAFNRAHTAGYGLVSYWTAYLKANYPAEYMAALLTTNADNKDKTALYLGECRRMGVEVLPPDINESEMNYTAVGDKIRVGLIGIKGIGEKAIEGWLVTRKRDGWAKDFGDYLAKAESSMSQKRSIEAMIKAGAFDRFGHSRSSLMYVHEEAIDKVKKAKKALEKALAKNQDALFDAPEMATITVDVPEIPEWERDEKLAMEREVLGLYVSDHPLAELAGALEVLSSATIADLRDSDNPPTDIIKIAGLVAAVDRKTTKKSGEPWAIVTVEDLDAAMQVYVFPRTYADSQDLLKKDAVLVFSGRAEKRDDGSTTFAVRDVIVPDLKAAQRKAKRLEEAGTDPQARKALKEALPVQSAAYYDDGTTDAINVNVHENQLTGSVIERFKALLAEYPGSRPVRLVITKHDGTLVRMQLGEEFKVVGTAQLAAEIRSLFGPEAV